MPFTPFHLGPALLFGLLFRRYVDFPTFVAASLLVDTRTALVFFGFLDGPLHGFLHTFVFASHLGIVLAAVFYCLRSCSSWVMDFFRLEQSKDWKNFLAAGLLGVWIHVLLDSFLYSDIQPFMPLDVNPLLGMFSAGAVYSFCTATFLLGSVYYVYLVVQAERLF